VACHFLLVVKEGLEEAGEEWLMLVILPTQEAEIRRIKV
jgi:hypothetical protein